jgi:uncharacterized membrane protein
VHLIWRRYSRSGYAPPAFYIVMALGFMALAIFSGMRGNWLITAIAVVMAGVTLAGSRVMRRLSDADASKRRRAEEDDDHVQ